MKSSIKHLVYGNTEVNENANKDSKLIPTMRDLTAGIVSKDIGLSDLLPKHIGDAHVSGDLHFHDLDYSPLYPMFNCMLIDVRGMLEKGFKLGNADIEQPKSIRTAATVVSQIIQQVASHIYGGNSINRIDEILAPYVRKSYHKHLQTGRQWTESEAKAAIFAREQVAKECYDAFQTLEYQTNSMQTTNGQTPFTTLNFGLGTSWEERLVQECILKVRIAGLGKEKKTAIFPKLVFTLREGVNMQEGDPNYYIKQLALECASKRMYPDIISYDQLVKRTGSFKAPMGCRSFLDVWTDEDGNEIHDGRNNLGVVSVNLPRIAIESEGCPNRFFELLDDRCNLAFEALQLRIDRFRGVKASVAPILYCEGAMGVRLNPEDEIMQLFENGRASVSLGYIGLHETVSYLDKDNAEHTFDSKRKQELAKGIVKILREYTDKWKRETGFAYGLYSTPSESLCDRFCRLDREKFGIIDGVNDKEYYTNSFHLDVFKHVDPFSKIDFEADFPTWASGGFISYVEFPNMQNNLEGLERVWDYAFKKLPYFGTNTPIDACACGWKGEATCTSHGFVCPNCGTNDPVLLNVTRRTCGYLGNPSARGWNRGKTVEMQNRVKHVE